MIHRRLLARVVTFYFVKITAQVSLKNGAIILQKKGDLEKKQDVWKNVVQKRGVLQ